MNEHDNKDDIVDEILYRHRRIITLLSRVTPSQHKVRRGMRFGRLVVVALDDIKYNKDYTKRKYYWLCQCDCGNEKVVFSGHLLSGTTKSCGCYHKVVQGFNGFIMKTKSLNARRTICRKCGKEFIKNKSYKSEIRRWKTGSEFKRNKMYEYCKKCRWTPDTIREIMAIEKELNSK